MLKLRELTEADESAFFAGLKDWEGERLSWYTFDWKPGMTFPELLAKLKQSQDEALIPAGMVPGTMLYGFVDGEIIGRLHVRHRLNEGLMRRGGHMGYAVAPRFRGRRYALEMARQALPVLRGLGVERALITCADHNTPSWKIIESIGGQLENKFLDETDQEMIRRYWVAL